MSHILPKRVLYIHHGKGLGGAPLSLLYLIKSLDRTHYDPLVLFLHDSDAFTLYKQQGIEVYGPVNRYDFSHTKIWWFRWYHIPYLMRALKDTLITYFSSAHFWIDKLAPDIIHLNTSSLIAWGAVAHQKKIPVIWHIREPLADGYFGIRRSLIKNCVQKYATVIVPISTHDGKPWEDGPQKKIIHNPVDQTIFDAHKYAGYARQKDFLKTPFVETLRLCSGCSGVEPPPIEQRGRPPTLLFLGGISQEKGTLVILQVFRELLKKLPTAKLVIAGYFDAHSTTHWLKKFMPAYQYKQKVASALENVQHATTVTGAIRNVPEVMAASNVIVFPATVGHFARPIIEAGFMKKPVIASKLSPLDELVIDEKTGYLIAPDNINAWVEKLYLLLTDANLNTQMGYQAYQFCTENFSLTHYQKKIASLYEHTLKTQSQQNFL